MKIAKYLVLPLALLILSGCAPRQKNVKNTAGDNAPPSKVLPYIKGTGISMLNQSVTSPSGEIISLIPSQENRLTVLSLWCPSCFKGSNAQLQELIKLNQAYAERGVRIIVIAYDTPSKELTEAIKNMKLLFEMGTGNQPLYDALQMKCIPATYYMDSAGAVIKTVEGFEALEEMSADIEELVRTYASEDSGADISGLNGSQTGSDASAAGDSAAPGSSAPAAKAPGSGSKNSAVFYSSDDGAGDKEDNKNMPATESEPARTQR